MTGPEWRLENVQSPFMQQQPAQMPKVLDPFRYCEFRVTEPAQYGEGGDVTICAVMASEVIREMAFCYQHGLEIQAALAAEGGAT